MPSADPVFRGDPLQPEQLLVAALSRCHMLSVLDLAASAGVVVTGYIDHPEGIMAERADGAGEFTEVVLRPRSQVTEQRMLTATEGLHERAHQLCFIARSVSFPVRYEASTSLAAPAPG